MTSPNTIVHHPPSSMKPLAFLLVLFLYVPAAEAQSFASVCKDSSPPRLEVKGGDLLVDGQKRFSVIVSYFDVMRYPQATIESDFAFLKGERSARNPDFSSMDTRTWPAHGSEARRDPLGLGWASPK